MLGLYTFRGRRGLLLAVLLPNREIHETELVGDAYGTVRIDIAGMPVPPVSLRPLLSTRRIKFYSPTLKIV